jgi:uncharacterized protein YbbK (DUF523 family)
LKPRIGVSACLLGEPVRYDGRSKPVEWIRQVLARQAELVALCPETGAGMPVPRPPVRLVRLEDGIHALGVEDPHRDVTCRLQTWARSMDGTLQSLQGVILKSRSPSCGLDSVPLHSITGGELGITSGLFAICLQQQYPRLVLIEETALEEAGARAAFMRALGLD